MTGFDFLSETTKLPAWQELLNKIGFLLHPERFKILFPYCFWYWVMCSILLHIGYKLLNKK